MKDESLKVDPEICIDCGENISECECWHGGIRE